MTQHRTPPEPHGADSPTSQLTASLQIQRLAEAKHKPAHDPITITDGYRFHLRTPTMSYAFHETYGDLMSDHWGSLLPSAYAIEEPDPGYPGWQVIQRRREFPTLGSGDFRTPAVVLASATGCESYAFKYAGYRVHKGKLKLPGMPATFGKEDEVTTLEVRMHDKANAVVVKMFYAVWHGHDVLSRWMVIENRGEKEITVKKCSQGTDLHVAEWELLHTYGNWAGERRVQRKRVGHGLQGLAGYTSHLAGQEYLLLTPSTTESSGPAWSFAHIYSGSFSAEIELDFNGHLRCQTGINPLHLSYPLPPGGIFTTPELVLSYTSHGIGTLSRNLHRFWKSHLFNTDWVGVPRPTLVNNWEATYFDLSEKKLLPIAERGAELGIQLFVLDDGWFGRKYPRTSDKQGLGDWEVNEERFPKGLGEFGERVTGLELGKKARSSLHGGGGEGGIKGGNGSESRGGREGRQDTREKDKPEHMRFGLWVEPEMISRRSHLFESHPDWVLRSPSTSPTETRNQLVLDLGQHQVQDFIISTLSRLLDSAPISYIKWDNNRAMHELPHPSAMHRYQLGLYRVLSTLTSKYPHVLWEGCASGGGRIDLALSAYFAQHWTSDNTDALDRLGIQFGTSLFFPPSIMGAHVSVVPNHQTSRTTPFEFRAHVALMAGSFGFELDVTKLSREEADMVPKFVRLARELADLVQRGDWFRLNNPWESNWPAGMFLDTEGKVGVVFWFQVRDHTRGDVAPPLRLLGLEREREYGLDGKRYNGGDLMDTGISIREHGDYRSRIMRLARV